MADNETGEERKLSRLGSFMDGVFTIAITLPIVQLTPPAAGPDHDLAAAYRRLTSGFFYSVPLADVDLHQKRTCCR